MTADAADSDTAERATRRPGGRELWMLAAVSVVAVAILLPLQWHHSMVDLKVYRLGGSTLLHDTPSLYSARMTAIALPFTYPPFAGVAMIPVAVLPWSVVVVLWTGGSAASLIVMWRMCLGEQPWGLLRRVHPALLTAVVLVSVLLEPVRETLGYGQINLMLCALVGYDLLVIRRRRFRGVWTGVAAGLKLTPLVFFGLLLVTRQWRALLNATAVFAATAVAGFVFAPRAAVEYWSSLVYDPTRIGALSYAGNQSWNGFLARITANPAGGGPAWIAGVLVVATGGLWLARALWLRADRLAALSTCALVGLICSPVSWSHHWVWVIPLGIALLRSTRVGRAHPIGTASAWFGLFLLGPIWWPPNHNEREQSWTTSELVVGNAYLIAAIIAAVLLSSDLRSRVPRKAVAQSTN